MSETELRRVFNVFIDNQVVTGLEFQKSGFRVQDVEKLKENGVVSNLGAVFILKKKYFSELFLFGISLLRKNNNGKALKVFEFCKKLNPDNTKVDYYIFITYLKLKDYENAMKYFINKPQKHWKSEDYFVLFLLSLIIALPEDYLIIANEYRLYYLNKGIESETSKFKDIQKLAFNYEIEAAINEIKKIDYDGDKKEVFQGLLNNASMNQANLNNIFNLLKNNESKIALPLTRRYLVNKNKYCYYELIKRLIELSYIVAGINEIIMDLLTNIENDEKLKIDISVFEELYNDDMEKGNYNRAKQIYYILEEINNLGIVNIRLSNFSKCLLMDRNN